MANHPNQPENNEEDYNINADADISGTEHLTEPVEDDAVESLKTELEASKDKYIRLAAEFDNFRRRTAKEKQEIYQTAGKDVITDLLVVLDDADRAMALADTATDKSAINEGFVLIINKIKNILQSKGLKPMEAIGQDFDPDLHDAVTEIPAPDPSLSGKVVDELTKGYYLNDKIIRHAKVVVGK